MKNYDNLSDNIGIHLVAFDKRHVRATRVVQAFLDKGVKDALKNILLKLVKQPKTVLQKFIEEFKEVLPHKEKPKAEAIEGITMKDELGMERALSGLNLGPADLNEVQALIDRYHASSFGRYAQEPLTH